MAEPAAQEIEIDMKELSQESLDVLENIYNYCKKKKVPYKRIFREAIYLKEFGTKTNNTSIYQLELVDATEFYNVLFKLGLVKTNATIKNLTEFLKVEHKPEFYLWPKLRKTLEKIFKLKKEKWGDDEMLQTGMSFSSDIEDDFLGH